MRATMTDAPRRVASPVAHQCRASAGLLQRRAPKASEALDLDLSLTQFLFFLSFFFGEEESNSLLLLRRRRVKLSG
ncbi:vegetative cell wall protein gp1-like [Iris pallida]|uniref:Vegetative cell wall protein gp1-like n=1 Tax=Iris pallida TaxID=29817 RepID=A0AAX6E1W0_IRIPA|nr:vegetative cell wall protein gp1-like [Iris pallida]